MNKLTWIDFLLRLIPEGFIIILSGYAVAKKRVELKPYMLSSVLFACLTFIFKILPISTILPMMISAIIGVILLIFINKINAVHAILSTILCFVLSIMLEGINALVLREAFGLDVDSIFSNSGSLIKNLYGLPSLLLFGFIVCGYYLLAVRRKSRNVTTQ